MTDTEKIKDKLDIITLISEYVQLKPAGTYHKGLCPFHNEKTPSFTVSKERQYFHCFGCSKHGDIFSFIQEIEGMDFSEALRFLAQKAGVELDFTRKQEVDGNQKNRLKEIHQKAAFFYHNVLTKLPVSEEARDYLTQRGLSQTTIQEWQIGFVPDQWDLLTTYLLKKGFGIDDLVASGLTIKKDGATSGSKKGFYDRFRGRVMFPIANAFGDVVAFTGRVLVETDKSGGKYVNSPQTKIYDKSAVLFGLDKAKKAIKDIGYAVIVEGQMDVIACHQAGFTNVVASSGTALTEVQLQLLKRYTTEIRMAFDGDAAGRAAAKRGIDIAISLGFEVKVIRIPEGKGKDPDECIKQDPNIWKNAVETAMHVMKWYMDDVFAGKDIASPRVKQSIGSAILQEIARIPFAIERDHWLRELSARLLVSTEVLREDLLSISSEKKELKKPKIQADESSEKKEERRSDSQLLSLVESIFGLLLITQEIIQETWSELPHEALSTIFELSTLYEYIENRYSTRESGSIIDSVSGTPLFDVCNSLALKGDAEFSTLTVLERKQELEKLSIRTRQRWVSLKRDHIERQMNQARAAGNKELENTLFIEYSKLL